MFKPLDPLLHNKLRLAVVSLLLNVVSADFKFLLEKTGATRGNLSVQISKLKDAGRMCKKGIVNNLLMKNYLSAFHLNSYFCA